VDVTKEYNTNCRTNGSGRREGCVVCEKAERVAKEERGKARGEKGAVRWRKRFFLVGKERSTPTGDSPRGNSSFSHLLLLFGISMRSKADDHYPLRG